MSNKTIETLKTLGLTEYEASAYLALTSNIKMTADEIYKATSIPLPRVYNVLESLERKGFVKIYPSRPRAFEAKPPNEALKSYTSFLYREFKDSMKRISEIEGELLQHLEPLFWERKMKTKGIELLKPLLSLEEAEKETLKLIDYSRRSLYILSAVFSWLPKVADALERAVDRGVEVKILLSASKHDTDLNIRMKEIGCKVRSSKIPWYPLRETIMDREEVVFVIWSSMEKETYWRPIDFKAHISSHPAIVNVFAENFESLWNKGIKLEATSY